MVVAGGPGRAVLILDAYRCGRLPWISPCGAASWGTRFKSARVHVCEMPGETTPFAKALGFAQRSSLESNGAGIRTLLPGCQDGVRRHSMGRGGRLRDFRSPISFCGTAGRMIGSTPARQPGEPRQGSRAATQQQGLLVSRSSGSRRVAAS